MRYFTSILFVLVLFFQSCNIHKRSTVPDHPVAIETNNAIDSVNAVAVIADKPADAIQPLIFDPSTVNIRYINQSENPPFYIGSSWNPQINFSSFYMTPFVAAKVEIDSISLKPDSIATVTNSIAPAKIIPKPHATILLEKKTSYTRYIIPGIATAFLATLFFFLAKRKKKDADQD